MEPVDDPRAEPVLGVVRELLRGADEALIRCTRSASGTRGGRPGLADLPHDRLPEADTAADEGRVQRGPHDSRAGVHRHTMSVPGTTDLRITTEWSAQEVEVTRQAVLDLRHVIA